MEDQKESGVSDFIYMKGNDVSDPQLQMEEMLDHLKLLDYEV